MFHDYFSEHELFTKSIRRCIEQDLAPHVDDWERAGHFPDDVFRTLGNNGFLGILIDEEFGGIGGDYRLASAWCEAFGALRSVGLTTGVNMHSVVVSHALNQYGTPQLKARWLPAAVRGEAIGAYAFTEPGAGSDLSSIRTKATRDGAKWTLNGSKTFITNGARAQFILVLARHDFAAGAQGYTTFCVDTEKPGFRVARKLDKLGWRASDTAELVFENLELTDEDILGAVGGGWTQASRSLNWERLMLTLNSLGGAKECFAATLRYASERVAFRRPIIEHGAVREMLRDMYRRIVLGAALVEKALQVVSSGNQSRIEVSVAKRQVCDDAVWIADRAIQIHGGYGYTTEFPPERWWRDLRLMPIGGGTSEIMASVAAKELGL